MNLYELMWKSLKQTVKQMQSVMPDMEAEFKLFEELMTDGEKVVWENYNKEEAK